MTRKLTRERIELIANFHRAMTLPPSHAEIEELARIALDAMDSSESVELPLDYLQGHKDGLEWAAQLAEANHPETGDWLYDDPIELAKAIRKGPDMPPVQPAPVVPNGLRLALSNAGIAAPESDEMLAATCEKHIQALVTWVKDRKPFQSAPVVPSFEEWLSAANRKPLGWVKDAMREASDACRTAMLAAAPQSPGSEPATVPGKWIPVSERMPDDDDFVYIWPRPDFGVELHVGQYCERSHKGGGWYAQVYEQNYGIEWHPITVTHWMPLPAAPQEVK